MTDFNTQVIEEFRANSGKVGGPFEQANVVLMTVTGAKSGAERTTPVVYFNDGDRIYVIASAGGSTKHPAWYHNLVANPELTVEVGTDKYRARAVPVTDDAERDRLYAHAVSLMPGFGEYEKQANRRIPVLYLDRV
ncbi:nitroreductase family deazaflavin-dependent oxidoreductase [Kutzneria kofuensis]|uniref:Deazaflavin-dependent oxidoreductase (Nitroreductase family) n=1 Tax=Kutzneria kofuensis TaxID=103725 RepID=A0A7W9KN81_9PSEU|nr:nitroreductase family deazaflavin-dependent oxidoreductase [Kutzneria kofuensis]MBB5894934.1 deazaflavin-dependent oxidoreductase (nitroreductase family) [Kutzneria kofuensis]